MFSKFLTKTAQQYRRIFEQYRRAGDLKCNKLDRPIFIWGAPCSGTTLLYQLLAKHPGVGYPQTGTLDPREGTDFWWRAFGEHRGVMDTKLLHPKRTRQICSDYERILEIQKKSRLLDKIPFMILWIALVDEIFPTARHFHVIRDGRAVVNSILYKLRYSTKEKHRRFQEEKILYGPCPPELVNPLLQPQPQRHARQWLYLVTYGQQNRPLLGERYLEIRYEDLVADPQRIMRQVLDHAQLDYNEQFIAEIFPAQLINRNYKWQSSEQIQVSDNYTAQKSLTDEDMPYLAEMSPLLQSLGYSAHRITD
ncbi:MAG: sulfotransferase [Anaerolineae bacterium]|nr:sulfotransferase [Anaerolineae bacterium]